MGPSHLERWLEAPVGMPDGTLVTRNKGTPHGAVALHVDAAGIDIGATEIYVAVLSERDPEPVRASPTFTEDLMKLADWLQECRIQT